jgi:hypothetical protein
MVCACAKEDRVRLVAVTMNDTTRTILLAIMVVATPYLCATLITIVDIILYAIRTVSIATITAGVVIVHSIFTVIAVSEVRFSTMRFIVFFCAF